MYVYNNFLTPLILLFTLLPDDSFIHVLINYIFFLEVFQIETKTDVYLQE